VPGPSRRDGARDHSKGPVPILPPHPPTGTEPFLTGPGHVSADPTRLSVASRHPGCNPRLDSSDRECPCVVRPKNLKTSLASRARGFTSGPAPPLHVDNTIVLLASAKKGSAPATGSRAHRLSVVRRVLAPTRSARPPVVRGPPLLRATGFGSRPRGRRGNAMIVLVRDQPVSLPPRGQPPPRSASRFPSKRCPPPVHRRARASDAVRHRAPHVLPARASKSSRARFVWLAVALVGERRPTNPPSGVDQFSRT